MKIRSPQMPLAVYREVAAHLQQVAGVETNLIPQPSQKFDYAQSQVGELWIQMSQDVAAADRQRVEQILAYYSDRYGAWDVLES